MDRTHSKVWSERRFVLLRTKFVRCFRCIELPLWPLQITWLSWNTEDSNTKRCKKTLQYLLGFWPKSPSTRMIKIPRSADKLKRSKKVSNWAKTTIQWTIYLALISRVTFKKCVEMYPSRTSKGYVFSMFYLFPGSWIKHQSTKTCWNQLKPLSCGCETSGSETELPINYGKNHSH